MQSLPSELIASIFAHLDLQSIQSCAQVNRLFHDVTKTPDLQYLILLEEQGQENGSLKSGSPLDKIEMLSQYSSRWDKLDFANEYAIPKSVDGHLWELYGNVLAQNYASPARIEFNQLPAHSRGIEKEQWTLQGFDFPVRDFGMDPAQNLLVLVENPGMRRDVSVPVREYRFHIRDIRTGEIHPQTTLKPAYVSMPQNKPAPEASYAVQTSGDFVGVHIQHHHVRGLSDELRVWNWKTGALKLQLTGDDMHSFAFLSDKHVAIAVNPSFDEDEQAHLKVIDFSQPTSELVDIEVCEYAMSFDLPPLDEDAELLEMHLRCDPSPVWRPSIPTPFFNALHNRVYTVTIWIRNSDQVHSFCLAVPLSTFRSHLDQSGPKRLTWGVWGPHGTRLIDLPHGHSTTWVCYVYGTRYVMPLIMNGQVVLEICDFNQVPALKEKSAQEESASDRVMKAFTDPSTSFIDVFAEPIITRLPYRRARLPLDRPPGGMLLSEDSLLIIRNNKYFIKTI